MVLDGNSLTHRAYHAINSLTTSQGVATNAVYGFTTMLFKLIEDEKPEYLAVAFDKGKVTFRHAEFADYKSQRAATPDDLRPQFPLIKQILQAMNIPVYELENYEADDLIGTLAHLAEEQGLETVIVSGDRDILQLVGPATKALITRKGISNLDIYDLQKIADKYGGLSPQQLIDVKSLEGDNSDNIPGVPSVGPKTAVKLIQQFGSIEEMFQRRGEIRGRVGQLLEDLEEQVRRSKWLATIVRDVPIQVDWNQCRYTGPNYDELIKVFRELEFRTLIKRVTAQMVRPAGPEPIIETGSIPVQKEVKQAFSEETEPVERDYWQVADEDELNTLVEELAALKQRASQTPLGAEQGQAPCVAIYLESTDPHPLRGQPTYLSLCWEQHRARRLRVPAATEDSSLSLRLRSQIKGWLEDGQLPKVFHDAKAALILLDQAGIQLNGLAGDTLLEAYLTNPGLAKLSLEELSLQYLNQLILPSDDSVWLAGRRADCIFQLHRFLVEQLQQMELTSLYREVELPLIRVLAEMEQAGVFLDAEALEGMSKELGTRLEELTKEIHVLAGEEFNINSTRQLGVILFEKLNLPVLKKTKTGYSTDAGVLEELAGQHEIVARILEHRQLVKLKSTYVDGMRHLVNPRTGKVHTTFNQAITATGRLSSTEPNLQNIPIRLEFGRRIRKFFAPSEPGWLILAADYSQIDLRALAHISEDEELIRAFREGRDIHTHTAAQVFGLPEELVTREMRYRAKAVNFGIVYGISDFGLARDLGISRTEAKRYIEQYLSTYRGVREFMSRIVREAREKGYVTTLLGRRRYLPEIFSSNRNVRGFGERAALNTPIQGTASDIIKVAMLKVAKEIKQCQLRSRMLLQVHDELIFEIPPNELAEMAGLVRQAMENAVTLRVPLVVDLEIGPNWYELMPLPKDF